MPRSDDHIPDHDLLLTADGEASSHRAAQVRAHLARCWACRARMAEIESAIVGFTQAHSRRILPPADGPRALLRARLSDLASARGRWFARLAPAAALAALCSVVLVSALLLRHSIRRHSISSAAAPARDTIPDRRLTPGATRPISIEQVCSMAHEEVVKDVPSDLRQKVFSEYDISNPRADDYEVDYLIAPGLGGADDIHNLWPQPYHAPTWNARTKDALEERLHQLVCARQLDLPTAQREIAVDWIAAYKKYFHTDTPGPSQSASAPPDPSATRVAALVPLRPE